MDASGARGRPFSNGVKPIHAAVFLAAYFIRRVYSSSSSGSGEGDHGDGHAGGGHEGHGYQVFHVEFERVQLPFIISLWIFVSSLAKIGFHMTPKLPNIFPESCLLIVVGILIGFLLILTSEEVPTTLTPDTFFLFMLPPIILDAGYFMPNRLFFDHLGTILLMAVVGTIFNMLTIGGALYACGQTGVFGDDPPGILETFLFASLIVAVDPVAVLAIFEEIHVDEILYIVVFGESLLNDAVTVVLYHMFEAYVEMGEENIAMTDIMKGFASFFVVAVGGTVIGIVWGYLTGFVTRFTNHARVLEPLFVFVMAYMSYLNAEIFHMSGILAITFCGIVMKNYVERNISSKSQTTLKYAMKMLSSSSETIIFMFLGVATIHDDHDWNWAFVGLTILFCSVFRIIGVLILVAIANNYRLHKLKVVDQFVMMYGGLRGAVAFALVLLIDKKSVPHAPMFVTTTIAMVYWTVFVQGITIKPLVMFLNVKTSSEKDPSMNERIAGRFMDHVVSGMEGVLGELGNLRMRDLYKYFDTKYIKPCLLRENQYKDPKIIETFENLTNRDAVEFMKRNPTQFAGLKSMVDLPAADSTANFGMMMGNMDRNGAGANSGLQLSALAPPPGGVTHDAVAEPMPRPPSYAEEENVDRKELNYTPSQRDVTENKIHHVLSENMFMPRARPRRMSYSRHAIKDEDMAMQHDVNFKVHMHVRRMMSENRAARKKKQMKKQGQGATSGVSFENEVDGKTRPGLRVVGSSKQLRDDAGIREALQEHPSSSEEDEFTEGITFKPRRESKQGAEKLGLNNQAFLSDEDDDTIAEAYEPTVAESTMPWRRKRGGNDDGDAPVASAAASAVSLSSAEGGADRPVRQREFPAWLSSQDNLDERDTDRQSTDRRE